jgi:hypothetical protein
MIELRLLQGGVGGRIERKPPTPDHQAASAARTTGKSMSVLATLLM